MNSRSKTPHIFLSYSRDDTHIMMRIRDELENAGICVWTDEGLVPGSDSWKRDIENAIRDALGIVVILSPSAKQSIWVERELGFARAQGIKVFPILVQGDTTNAIPIDLINSQWVDIRNEANFSIEMQNLIWALQAKPGASDETAQLQRSKPVSTPPKSKQLTGKIVTIAVIVIGICLIGAVTAILGTIFFPDLFGISQSPSITPSSTQNPPTQPQPTDVPTMPTATISPLEETQSVGDDATFPPTTVAPTPIPTSTAVPSRGFEECISASVWTAYPPNSPTSTDNQGCLVASNLGFYNQNESVTISVQNPSVEQRYGIYSRIDSDVLIELDVRIDQLTTNIVDRLGSLGIGIMTLNPRNTETDGFTYYVIENPDPSYPVFLKKKERGGFEQYIQISGDYVRYPLGTTQKLSLVLEGNRLTIYIDGDLIRETTLPNAEYAFFIGYKFEDTGNLSAQISKLSIQEK